MNSMQQSWFERMEANIGTMRDQYAARVNFTAKATETSRKIQEAVRRMQEAGKLAPIISEEEYGEINEWFDGEADCHVEWLDVCLRKLRKAVA